MGDNVNTRAYWDHRFASGDWEANAGPLTTASFARAQVRFLDIPREFTGAILDFGCGLGDAIPVYRAHFPKARLFGLDFSRAAIETCRRKYGAEATFLQGQAADVPAEMDVIIASNVLEHLDNDLEVARTLRGKCADLYIAVPYREQPLYGEHIRSYDEEHFSALGACTWQVYSCVGWSTRGRQLWVETYLKNIFRWVRGRPLFRRRRQILFRFRGARPLPA